MAHFVANRRHARISPDTVQLAATHGGRMDYKSRKIPTSNPRAPEILNIVE